MTNDEIINNKVDWHAKAAVDKYGADQWWCTMLYGSQNYGLANEHSDVDTKTLIIPRFSDVALGRAMVSDVLTMPDGSLSTVKDFRGMFKNYLKGNINFVETLFTDYYTVNPKYEKYWTRLLDERDIIANCQPLRLVRMATGMAHQKYAALEKPTPARQAVIDRFGYDPKQLHHLARLKIFINDYVDNRDFYHALRSGVNEFESYLLNIKDGVFDLENARQLANVTLRAVDDACDRAADRLPEQTWYYDEAKGFFDDLTLEMFEDIWKEQLASKKFL